MSTIVISGVPFELTPETQKLFDVLAADVETHNSDWEKIERQAESLRQIQDEDWSTGDEAIAVKVREKSRELLGREIELRKRIGEFYGTVQARDYPAARDRADQAFDLATADVRQGLLALGYVDGLIPGAAQNSLIPDMYWRHPRVYQARLNREALQGFDATAHCQSNKAAIDKAKAALAEAKQQATASLS